ncbi:MFS transporter [Pararhodobacter zhoushanensis]|uniref:MFS transporter n=1 Tax=Pararhodobacter zhoushanensis TaxID=2479545 RepID=A0ABT3GTX0_9RHOB|nr:MFS transporter [Pararhodobacter zhoushanensis]MCW1930977.1 MFS transporter [Pararhodobacter zhoushanensis]
MSQIFDTRYSWSRLALSLGIATVGNVGMWSIIALLPAVQAEFGGGRGDASVPYTLTMAGFALGNLVLGRVVDRFGVSVALSLAALLSSFGYVLAALSPTIWLLSGAQFLIGLGTACFFGPLLADISLWFRKRRGIAVAIAASGNYLAGAIWPLALSGVLAASGWRAVCWVLAALVPVVVIPAAQFLRRRVPAESMTATAQATSLIPRRAPYSPRTLAWMLALAGIGCCVAMSMPQVHLVAFCVDLGYGPAVGAEMLSVMLMGGVVSRLISGFITDRLGGIPTLLIGSVGQMIGLFLYLPFDGLVSLYVVSLIFGLSQGGIVPAYAIIVREYMPAREAGARVGFVIMATIVGMALGGWMSGWIYDVSGSYTMAFVNGIAWNLLNIVVILTILLRSRPGRATGALATA